jgi:hypothetical protein
MSELVKAIMVAVGIAITMYVTQREQVYQIEALEKSLDLRAKEMNEVRKDINLIQISLARVSSRECQTTAPGRTWEQSFLAK